MDYPMMISQNKFNRDWLTIDAETEVNKICSGLRAGILNTLHKQGGVVGVSGGIDSAVVLALLVKSLGPDHVLAILMPDRESHPDSAKLAQLLADQLGVKTVIECITDILEKNGCYKRRDEAIKKAIPEYCPPEWSAKIVLPGDLLDNNILNVYRLVVAGPDHGEISTRLHKDVYQQIMAASNLKQRTRMNILYYYAEACNYAVVGTANKNEYDLGFFVKYGDGGVDINPIQHLFKTQVYQLGKYLDIPEEILKKIPTTDTYPGGCTQEEFFYRVPFEILDLVWLGYEKGIAASEIANALDLTPEQVSRVIADIQSKIRTTSYLRKPPLSFLIE